MRSASWGLLVAAVFLHACGEAPPCAGPQLEQPYNLVLVSLDTLRADRLNCYGYEDHRVSPSIDALAADGVLFENVITTSPWTVPSHFSMLTSLHPSSHGVMRSFFEIMDDVENGRVYDRLADERLTLAEALADQGYATAAFTAGRTMSREIGFDQGFSVYSQTMFKLGTRNTGGMKRWVGEHAQGPFFLFWHTFEVHAPYIRTRFLGDVLPPEKAQAVTAAVEANTRARARRERLGFGLAQILEKHGVFNRQVCDALYMGGVAEADRWVGDLMAMLREQGLYDRTLIVVTSDHGEELGFRSDEHIYDAHGHTLYDELLRVPLIVKLPGQCHAGTRVESLASLLDIMPTVLDVLSVSTPTSEMQGRSLRPDWEGRDGPETPAVYSEALGEDHEKKAVRTDQYKLIISMDAQTVAQHGRRFVPAEPSQRELYDLERDPEERRNLLDRPLDAGLAKLARELDRDLRVHLARQQAKASTTKLSKDTIEKLRLLGYIE